MRKPRMLLFTLILILAAAANFSAQDFYRNIRVGEADLFTVTIEPWKTRVEGNYIVWEPSAGRMTDTFETVYIVYDTFSSWFQMAFEDLEQPVTVVMTIARMSPGALASSDPNGAAPLDGFTKEWYFGIIEGIPE